MPGCHREPADEPCVKQYRVANLNLFLHAEKDNTYRPQKHNHDLVETAPSKRLVARETGHEMLVKEEAFNEVTVSNVSKNWLLSL